MERHPLIFVSVLIFIGVLNGLTLSYIALLHHRVKPVTTLLMNLRADIDALLTPEAQRHGS